MTRKVRFEQIRMLRIGLCLNTLAWYDEIDRDIFVWKFKIV